MARPGLEASTLQQTRSSSLVHRPIMRITQLVNKHKGPKSPFGSCNIATHDEFESELCTDAPATPCTDHSAPCLIKFMPSAITTSAHRSRARLASGHKPFTVKRQSQLHPQLDNLPSQPSLAKRLLLEDKNPRFNFSKASRSSRAIPEECNVDAAKIVNSSFWCQ